MHLISKLIIKSQVPEGFDLKNLNLSFRKFLKKIDAFYPVDAKASHLTPPRLTRPSVLLDYKKNINKDLKIPDYFYKKIIAEKNNDYSSLEIERGIYLHKVIETLIGIIYEERLSYLNQLVHDEKITLFDKENLLHIFKSYTYLFKGDGYIEFSLVEEGQLYRIDYFVINGREGYIIDFKTGKRTSSKTELYKKQVEQYASLLSKIYKNLSLKCFLLWIDERAVDEWIYKI